jgi:O-antigen/teichoic acid export membrane protein
LLIVVLRNSLYNILGLGLPLIVAVAAIPQLIHHLGEERFGILTIIWAVVSYFGLFDLGLGRAVTQQVAAAMASGDEEQLQRIVGTSSGLMLALGLFGGVVMLVTAPLLAREFVHTGDPTEVTHAFYWMALAMPAIVLTSGYRGILEAVGRFGLINAIRVPMGVFTFAGPLAVVWAGDPRLDTISAVLCLGRFLACAFHGVYAMRSLPPQIGAGKFDRQLIKSLLSMGGWISVSNIIAPLMNYADRFALGVMLSATAVAYYATPQELILRIGIIPAAIAAVLFPLFAAGGTRRDADRDTKHLRRYSALIFVLLLPMVLFLAVLARPLLSWWISPAFAQNAAPIMQIMSIAALAGGLSQVPFAMLQGQGRADVTAKLHMIEFPIFLALLYVLIVNYGAVGAAWAWLVRIVGDFLALWIMCSRHIARGQENTGSAGI